MKYLKPIYDHDSYSNPIAREIFLLFEAEIFSPLLALVKTEREKFNSASALESALREGKIRYDGEYFKGNLKAAISKELRGIGAIYNHTKKAYKLSVALLPQNIKQAIVDGKMQSTAVVKRIEDYLKAMEGREIKVTGIGEHLEKTFGKLDAQFQQTTKVITARDIEIPLQDKFKEQLKDAYTENLDLYIQGWYDEQILRLREKVYQNVQEGYRAENLVETIMSERDVTKRKAVFLAKQETSLMVSNYRELRYREIGVNKYQWSTSQDVRVRADHRALNGQIFDWEHPPVTNKQTGARNSPGEDFGCRCIAIPVLSDRNLLERKYANK